MAEREYYNKGYKAFEEFARYPFHSQARLETGWKLFCTEKAESPEWYAWRDGSMFADPELLTGRINLLWNTCC